MTKTDDSLEKHALCEETLYRHAIDSIRHLYVVSQEEDPTGENAFFESAIYFIFIEAISILTKDGWEETSLMEDIMEHSSGNRIQ